MKLITSKMLKGACGDQKKLFDKLFPGGAPVTIAAAREASKAGLDVLWLVNILPKPLLDEHEAKCKRLLVSLLRRVEEKGCVINTGNDN